MLQILHIKSSPSKDGDDTNIVSHGFSGQNSCTTLLNSAFSNGEAALTCNMINCQEIKKKVNFFNMLGLRAIVHM